MLRSLGYVLMCLICEVVTLRTINTLGGGTYTLQDSSCSLYRKTESGFKYALIVPSGFHGRVNRLNVMLSMGGAGSSRQSWEDVASRVWERVIPCKEVVRERTSLTLPTDTPERVECKTSTPWVVIGAVAPKGLAFYTDEGCKFLSDLTTSALESDDLKNLITADTQVTFHISGSSSGGISAFNCAVRYPALFHSVAVFPGYFQEDDSVGGDAAKVSLKGKQIRVWVGQHDTHFREMAEEQFTHASIDDRVESPLVEKDSSSSVRIIAGSGHDVLPELDPSEVCLWLKEVENVVCTP